MKFRPLIAVGTVSLLLVATACSPEQSTKEGSQGGTQSHSIRLAHVFPASSAISVAADEIKEDVEQKSDGRLTVTVHGGGELGGDTELAQGLISGTIECALINYGAGSIDPRLSLGNMPYLAPSFGQVDKLFYEDDGFVMKHDRQVLEGVNLNLVAMLENEYRGLSNNVRPVTAPEDLKGLKIRVSQNPILLALFDQLGAQAEAIPFPELYTALQQGTVDGQENGPILTADSNFGEVQKYYTTLNHVYAQAGVVCNIDRLSELPDDLQEILVTASTVAAARQVEVNRKLAASKLDKLREQGVEIIELSDKELAAFQDEALPVWTELEEIFGADVLAELRQAAVEARG